MPRTMGEVFRQKLISEFAARKLANPRYSLRAFANFLGTDHSTLSKVMTGARPTTSKQLRTIGRKLGISAEEISVHLAAEHVPDPSITRRQEMLRHWTPELMALISGELHWKIVRLSRSSAFRADCRWITFQVAASRDDVNLALTRLPRLE
jgi:transcriptional regulator with XRE-family HTH domain